MRFSFVISAVVFAATTATAFPATLATQPKKPAPAVNQPGPSGGPPRKFFDCHRDVRKHRINGVYLWHRHVGSNCEIRVVNRVN